MILVVAVELRAAEGIMEGHMHRVGDVGGEENPTVRPAPVLEQPDNSVQRARLDEHEVDDQGPHPVLDRARHDLENGEPDDDEGEDAPRRPRPQNLKHGKYQTSDDLYTNDDVYKNKLRWLRAALGIIEGEIDFVFGTGDEVDELVREAISHSALGVVQARLQGDIAETEADRLEDGRRGLVQHRSVKNTLSTNGRSRKHFRGKNVNWSRADKILPPNYADQLATLICEPMAVKWKVARGMLKDGFISSLNAEEWTPIIKNLLFKNGNQYESKFVPINACFDVNFAHYGTTGNASMSPRLRDDVGHDKRLEDRTTNAWLTQYKAENGKTIFEAFRSGTLAYTFEDLPEQRRKDIAQHKTRELLKAVALQHIDTKLTPAQRIDALAGRYPVHIDFVSINLQTPGKIGVLGAEYRHVHDEWEALTSFQGLNMFSLMFGGQRRTVAIDFNVISLDTGVNAARTLRGVDKSGKAIGKQRKINKDLDHGIPALEKLVDDYVEAAERTIQVLGLEIEDMDDDDRRLGGKQTQLAGERDRLGKVKGLWKQISKKWKKGGTLYELPARIANLTFLMGHSVHFNCKSGKDRTGFMDVESKFLAQQMHEKGVVPRYENKLEGDDKEEHRRLLFESGNLEVQEKNTGSKGYKIAPMRVVERDLWNRVGRSLNLAQGLGDLTVVEHEYKKSKNTEVEDV